MTGARPEPSAEIVLRLDGVCVETAARRAHRALTARLLEDDATATEDSATRYELLTRFLEEADFKSLRATDPLLRGETEDTVTVAYTEDRGWERLRSKPT